jgi:hypothetical protein
MKDAVIISAVHSETRQEKSFAWCCGFLLWLCAVTVPSAAAQTGVRFIPDRTGEQAKLMYGGKLALIKMEDEADLPGNPAHHYQVLFTAVKVQHVYLLLRVCSRSPMSNPMGPCGGDEPCALLWIKADKDMAHHEIKSEIFASCSYNFDQIGKTRIAGGKLFIVYQDTSQRKKIELSYDNAHPDQGILRREI